ncbi:hypothetical protein Bca4012_010262 [Brassica carinata]
MFGLLKKSKPQQDVYFPFKTVLEKEQMIFGNKKQFVSNGFDFVQKQRNQRKRQNRFEDDEKRIRSGDRPFTKAKRSNRDVFDQNELQTYASLEKMLHKAIHAIRQLKRKGNTNTSSTSKQQCKSSYLSNSDLKTNEISSDKSKAVKTTSKAHFTRCFKCHRIGHYANKCQKQKPLVTLENDNVETEPEREEISVPLTIFDDFTHEQMEVLDEEQIHDHRANQEGSSSIQEPDQTQDNQCVDYDSCAYTPFPFNVSDLRTNLFEEEGNDVPWDSGPSKTNMHGLIMGSSNDICSLFDSYIPNHDAFTHEITWRTCSTQFRSSSKKNQLKRSSDVGVMPFSNQMIFDSREFRHGAFNEGMS